MYGSLKDRNGFTLVELLIAIVVIAIIAAISVVTYGGIQGRAEHSVRTSAARQMLQILRLYNAEHGTYPEINGPAENIGANHRVACLGKGWPEVDGSGVCWNIYDDRSVSLSRFRVSDSVMADLARYGSMPDWPQKPVWRGQYRLNVMDLNGLVLRWQREATGNYPAGWTLAWTIRNNASCDVPGAEQRPFGPPHDLDADYCIVPLD